MGPAQGVGHHQHQGIFFATGRHRKGTVAVNQRSVGVVTGVPGARCLADGCLRRLDMRTTAKRGAQNAAAGALTAVPPHRTRRCRTGEVTGDWPILAPRSGSSRQPWSSLSAGPQTVGPLGVHRCPEGPNTVVVSLAICRSFTGRAKDGGKRRQISVWGWRKPALSFLRRIQLPSRRESFEEKTACSVPS